MYPMISSPPLRRLLLIVYVLAASPAVGQTADEGLRNEARQGLRRACAFYRTEVASHGGYAYYYSEELSRRWGEGEVDLETIVVQPPGTPTVGTAYLKAYEATGERFYLDAARDAAGALVEGQLVSGGWSQVIHFGPAKRLGNYRTRKGGKMNNSSLDDDQTQSALRMLMQADRALGFQDARIHEAARFGLDALLAAQFPNGAFPQVWTQPASPQPVLQASYPEYDWRTEGRLKNYWDYYTLNDGLAGTVAETLIAAHEVYGDPRYRAALVRLGDFLLAAQMPAPQPAWCQQYNYAMQPIWARKFEPPSITGSESQDVMRTLVTIARQTGQRKYLEAIPPAVAYFRTSLLPDGQLARFYELRTNRPLYMDADYRLTYDDSHAPSHYGWKAPARLDAVERAYQAALADLRPLAPRTAKVSPGEVRRILDALDAQGRWVSTAAGERLTGQPKFPAGSRYLSSAAFSRNVQRLSAYLTESDEW